MFFFCFFAPTFSYFNEFITIGIFIFLLDFDKVLSMMLTIIDANRPNWHNLAGNQPLGSDMQIQ